MRPRRSRDAGGGLVGRDPAPAARSLSPQAGEVNGGELPQSPLFLPPSKSMIAPCMNSTGLPAIIATIAATSSGLPTRSVFSSASSAFSASSLRRLARRHHAIEPRGQPAGVDGAGVDGVDPHAVDHAAVGLRLGQQSKRRVHRADRVEAARPGAPRYPRNMDDSAARRLEVRPGELRHPHISEELEPEAVGPVGIRQREEAAALGRTGTVHQQIKLAERLHRRVNGAAAPPPDRRGRPRSPRPCGPWLRSPS